MKKVLQALLFIAVSMQLVFAVPAYGAGFFAEQSQHEHHSQSTESIAHDHHAHHQAAHEQAQDVNSQEDCATIHHCTGSHCPGIFSTVSAPYAADTPQMYGAFAQSFALAIPQPDIERPKWL